MDIDSAKLGFIVGHYKSGSTWLLNLLSLHPEIRGVGETHVFRYADNHFPKAIERLFKESSWGALRTNPLRHWGAIWTRPLRIVFGLASGQATLSTKDRPTNRSDLRLRTQSRLRFDLAKSSNSDEFCRVFFGHLLNELSPRRYLIEKTPNNIFNVPRIVSLFPKAKLLAIYRDGRDVVTSERFHRSRLGRPVDCLEKRIDRWRMAMETQRRFKEKYNILCISYESLLEDPHTSLVRIMDYLELSNEPNVLEDMIGRSAFEFVTGREGGEEMAHFYRKGVRGDWINHFSKLDRQVFSQVAGDLLLELGYESENDPASW